MILFTVVDLLSQLHDTHATRMQSVVYAQCGPSLYLHVSTTCWYCDKMAINRQINNRPVDSSLRSLCILAKFQWGRVSENAKYVWSGVGKSCNISSAYEHGYFGVLGGRKPCMFTLITPFLLI